jgi:hypothetical protein
MGDLAEGVFEASYEQKYVRFGLNRPPINLATVPAFVRYTPDFLTSKGLVEVQGFGKDQVAKFKENKLAALHEWHRFFRVDFFLWDSANRRFGWVRLPELDESLAAHGSNMRFENDGNSYFALRADCIPVVGGWVPFGEMLGSSR